MAVFSEVRAALAATIREQLQLECSPFTPRQVAGSPAAFISQISGARETLGGGETADITVAFVAVASTDDSWAVLDGLREGDRSVFAVLDEHTDLGLEDVMARPTGEWSEVLVEVGGTQYVGFTMPVVVHF